MDSTKISVRPLIGSSDWPLWKYKIQLILKSQPGALGVVEGTYVAPQPLPASPATSASEVEKFQKEMDAFEKANVAAMTILSNTLTDDTLGKVMRFTNARQVWLELSILFEPASETQLFDLCTRFLAWFKMKTA